MSYAQFGYSYPSASQHLVSGAQPTITASPSISTGSALSPGAVSPSSIAGTTPGAAQPLGSDGTNTSVSGQNGTGCCGNGRPVLADPLTGQTICSCQYDNATRLALGTYSRLGATVASYSSYTTPSSVEQGPYANIGMDNSAFYSSLGNPYGIKDAATMSMTADMGTTWTAASLQPTTGYYHYDPTLAAYGYGAGYDLAARRKNATRESTATLKAWLNEHKKNPYPTKGEKIMLAIITKMTLTQVSTWFANARRRLKKENKMTWEPKNKTDDDDDTNLSDLEDNKEKIDLIMHAQNDRVEHDTEDDADLERETVHNVKAELDQHEQEIYEDHLDLKDNLRRISDRSFRQVLHHQEHQNYVFSEHVKGENIKTECGITVVPIPPTKPKIWSLADTAACKTPPPLNPHHENYNFQRQQSPYTHQSYPERNNPHQQLHQSWLASVSSAGAGCRSDNLSTITFPVAMTINHSSTPNVPYTVSDMQYSGFLSSPTNGPILYHTNPSSGTTCNTSIPTQFPEVGTDTPPQTPPSMKFAIPNGALQTLTSSYNSSNISNINSTHVPNVYTSNYNSTYLQPISESVRDVSSFHLQRHGSPHAETPNSTVPDKTSNHLTDTVATTAFKPFYKGKSKAITKE